MKSMSVMAYSLTSSDLSGYLAERLKEHHMHFEVEKRDGISIKRKIGSQNKYYDLVPKFIKGESGSCDKIELTPRDDSKSPENLAEFLEAEVNSDAIFTKPHRLYSPEREKLLKSWRSVLRRLPANDRMICEVIEPNSSTERLRRIFYEYMARPALAYLLS